MKNVDRKRLADYVGRPDVQDEILGAYEGGYSLGLTSVPDNQGEVAIRVRIEGEDISTISDHVTWGGQAIPVLISTNFKVPKPQGGLAIVHAPFTLTQMR